MDNKMYRVHLRATAYMLHGERQLARELGHEKLAAAFQVAIDRADDVLGELAMEQLALQWEQMTAPPTEP